MSELEKDGPLVAAVARETPADDRLYPLRPIVGVGVVVFRGNDVLLVRRGKAPRKGDWSIPGGAQELGETVEQAAAREVLEETGVEIALSGFVAVVDSIRPDGEGRIRSHYTLIDFSGEWRGGDLRPGDDADDCRWVPLDALDEYRLWSETLRIIELAAERRERPPHQ